MGRYCCGYLLLVDREISSGSLVLSLFESMVSVRAIGDGFVNGVGDGVGNGERN